MAAAYAAHVFLFECLTLTQVFDAYLDHVISPVGSGLRSDTDNRQQPGVCRERNLAHTNRGIFCASPRLFAPYQDKALSFYQLLIARSEYPKTKNAATGPKRMLEPNSLSGNIRLIRQTIVNSEPVATLG
jgi:hypothetical protein